MIGIVLKRAFEEYFSNARVMVSFGVLFVFLAVFAFFNQFFFTAGTVFLSFDISLLGAIGLVLVLVFLYVFSFFVSLTVYSVHRDVQNISFDTYWNGLFRVAALRIFVLYLIVAIVLYIISVIGFMYGFTLIALIINLIIALLVMFAPQSIVLDEAKVGEAVGKSIEFWFSKTLTAIGILVIASVILFVAVFIELYLELAALPGSIVSFFIIMVFLVPFIEQSKSYAYLMKVDLLKSNEFVHARAPRIERVKFKHATRLREQPRNGSKI